MDDASPRTAEWRAPLDEARALRESRPADALRPARAGAELAAAAGDRVGEARCLLVLAQCEHASGRQEDAIAHLRRARSLASEADDSGLEANVLRELGIVHDALGAYDEAFAVYLEARTRYARNEDVSGEASLLNSIGIVLSKAGQHEQGLEFYREAVALHDVSPAPGGKAPVLNNIGINLRRLARLDEARAALEEALAVFPAQTHGIQRAAVLCNLSRVHADLGEAVIAERFFRESLQLAGGGAHPRVEADALHGLGDLLMSIGRLEEAGPMLERALVLALASAPPDQQLDCQLALSRLHERTGHAASALRHFQAYHELDRRLFNERSDAKLKGLQIRHRVAELERQTLEDGLTGLANRRLFDRQLKSELARARKHGRPLALALCDVDDFKSVNDRFSHVAGDETLRQLAALLDEACGDAGLVARFGGEEFALILPEVDATDAARACEEARRAVERHDWTSVQPGLRVTMSVGYALASPGDSELDLIRRADDRLYAAKRAGKNRVSG